MVNTKNFRTKQEFITKMNPKGKDYIIGLDAGYSGMKVFYENGLFCFPSFAKKIDEETFTGTDEKDILYRDLETNELFVLGYTAQNMVMSSDTNDTDGELRTRKRYGNRKFQILCKAAIACALKGKKDNRKIVIQTGLPSAYVDADKRDMVKELCKPAHFQLRVGMEDWKEFHLELDADAVHCDMPQPAGSLYSVVIGNDGKYVQNARDFLYGNTLVLDAGFGTFDFYGLKNRTIACKESIDEIGMYEILKHTSKKILDELNEDINIQALQKNLEQGTVVYVDEDEMRSDEKQLSPMLEEAVDEVYKEAFDRTKAVTNSFRDYRNIIVTGGTGEAWIDKFRSSLANMKTIRVVPGNVNDHLPLVYSNVRGYYFARYNQNIR